MGITGHITLLSNDELDHLIANPAELYAMPERAEEFHGIPIAATSYFEVSDLSAMSFLLAGEYPGAPQPGPDRPIAFLTRGGERVQFDAYFLHPTLNGNFTLHEARKFGPADLAAEVRALLQFLQVGVRERAPELRRVSALLSKLTSLVSKRTLAVADAPSLYVAEHHLFLITNKDLAEIIGSVRRRGERAPDPPPQPWLELEKDSTRHVDFDKIWDAMIRILETSDPNSNLPWCDLFEKGGVPIGDDVTKSFGYGVARAYRPQDVARLAARLNLLEESRLIESTKVMGEVYRIARRVPDDYLAIARSLRRVLNDGAAAGRGMIAYLS